MNLVWKLLRQHISKSQLTGFFVANLAGMFIVLLSVQVYSDLRPLFSGGESFLNKDYLILTKKINAYNSLAGNGSIFTKEEIEEIRQQSFVRKANGFTPSGYGVTAGINMGGRGFATEMFFESVPDEYVDVTTTSWKFDAAEGVIPIIIPRNYLNLYNFGFAQARNLPKLSERVIGSLRLQIELKGKEKRQNFEGRIVGFSDRLNTILVPQQFMDWANQTFAPEKPVGFSRLIVEAGNPADPHIVHYFKGKNYETEDGKLDAGKTMWFLNTLTSAVIVIGLIICALSLYILMLSIFLLLQKNNVKLQNLILIGYRTTQIARPYQNLTLALNGVVFCIALIAVFLMRYYYIGWLKEIWPDFVPGSSGLLWGIGVTLFSVVSLLNIVVIRSKINKL